MADIILTGLLLAVWLPGVAWAFAWWDVKKRQAGAAQGDAEKFLALRKSIDAWATDHGHLKQSMADFKVDHENRLSVLERNLREAGLNPKTPLSKQAGMMPFGKRG